jgi:hypothetical protein
MPTDTRPSLAFPIRSRLAVLRDLAMVAVCVAIVASFLVDIWEARPPKDHRVHATVADARRGA